MDNIVLNDKLAVMYINDVINEVICGTVTVNNANYHHNSNYKFASSIIKHGILTIDDMQTKGIVNYSDDELTIKRDNTSHINGTDAVSLSVVGLTDLYRDEDEYFPFSNYEIDFLVDDEVKTDRVAINYGNEFLSYKSIPNDMIRSVDLKLLEYVNDKNCNIKEAVGKFNYLVTVAKTLKNSKLNIPLRETSYDKNNMLDINKISSIPKLVLKKQ